MGDIRLQLEAHATADANGNATVRFGNAPPFCRWIVEQLSISLSRGTGVAVVTHGPTISAPLDIDNTHLSQANRTSPTGWELLPGESCTISFSLVQVGAIVSATLRGRQVPFP